MNWTLHFAEREAAMLSSFGPDLYEQTDRVCRAVAAARDALIANLTEIELDRLNKKIDTEVKDGLAELDRRRGK